MSAPGPAAVVPPLEPPPVARIAGVGLRYGRAVALESVSLDLPAGVMVGFIGPDGVGKSSLLALIAGARAIQSGRIEALDGDMASARHRDAVCPRIAYMPQGLGKNLYPTLSVHENVDFFARLFGHGRRERERRIADLLLHDAAQLTIRPPADSRHDNGGQQRDDPDVLALQHVQSAG